MFCPNKAPWSHAICGTLTATLLFAGFLAQESKADDRYPDRSSELFPDPTPQLVTLGIVLVVGMVLIVHAIHEWHQRATEEPDSLEVSFRTQADRGPVEFLTRKVAGQAASLLLTAGPIGIRDNLAVRPSGPDDSLRSIGDWRQIPQDHESDTLTMLEERAVWTAHLASPVSLRRTCDWSRGGAGACPGALNQAAMIDLSHIEALRTQARIHATRE